MRSYTFDDLEAGTELAGSSRTITDAEIALMPAFMGVINPLFHDEPAAQRGPLGGRVLYGPALLGIAIGLTEPLFADAAMGLVSLDEVRFLAPVHAGDTVTARLTVERLEPSSSRPAGRVSVADEVINQNERIVLRFRRTLLLRARG